MDKHARKHYNKSKQNKLRFTGVKKMSISPRTAYVEYPVTKKKEAKQIVSAVEHRKRMGLKSKSLFGKTLVDMYKEGK